MAKELTPQEILENPDNVVCTCQENCEFHGKCKECIALHRYYKHIPDCIQKVLSKAEESADT